MQSVRTFARRHLQGSHTSLPIGVILIFVSCRTNLAPVKEGGGGRPTGELLTAIEASFGSYDAFQTSFTAASIGVQGSGWGWLGYNKALKRVEILTKPNQDPLTELVPLLGFDVWEHAYYYRTSCSTDTRIDAECARTRV
jgi:superoxide dismutase